MAHGAAAGPG